MFRRNDAVRIFIALSLCAVGANVVLAHDGDHQHHGAIAQAITDRAQVLVDSMGDKPPRFGGEQRLLFDFDDPQRREMGFFPLSMQTTAGVRLGAMSRDSRRAVHGLLGAVLGDQGYLRVQLIQSLEDVLRRTDTGGFGLRRLPDDYSIQIFGHPGREAPWGMKFQGHHLSVNATVDGDHIRATPMFLGVNPAEVRAGPSMGLRVLAPQQDLAFQLLRSLSPEQQVAAWPERDLDRRAILQQGPVSPVGPSEGIAGKAMTEAQQVLLFDLVRSYALNVRPEIAGEELRRLTDAGLDRLHFLWRGADNPDTRHYYRIQGPTVLVEFEAVVDSPDAPANHLHTQWRDPERDFGIDLLHDHRQASHEAGDDG